jgi:hypothetical protein
VEEKALVGWKAIADFLGWTVSKAMSRRKELREAEIIFATLKGKPPNRRRVVFTFPSLLIKWCKNYQTLPWERKKRWRKSY